MTKPGICRICGHNPTAQDSNYAMCSDCDRKTDELAAKMVDAKLACDEAIDKTVMAWDELCERAARRIKSAIAWLCGKARK